MDSEESSLANVSSSSPFVFEKGQLTADQNEGSSSNGQPNSEEKEAGSSSKAISVNQSPEAGASTTRDIRNIFINQTPVPGPSSKRDVNVLDWPASTSKEHGPFQIPIEIYECIISCTKPSRIPIRANYKDAEKSKHRPFRYFDYSPQTTIHHVRANRMMRLLIQCALRNAAIDEHSMKCVCCNLLPSEPVTGKCGHTSCMSCIVAHRLKFQMDESFRGCPCGEAGYETLHVSVMARDILEKLKCSEENLRNYMKRLFKASRQKKMKSLPASSTSCQLPANAEGECQLLDKASRLPITAQARFNFAIYLIESAQFLEAASHLARVIVTGTYQLAIKARRLMQKVMVHIAKEYYSPRLEKFLRNLVKMQSAKMWLKLKDVECVLCFETLRNPVTTSCGHTYCRICVERAIDYNLPCPLCKRSMADFDFSSKSPVAILHLALESIDAVSVERLDPNVIPICSCTIAYPGVPCSVYIYQPRQWVMVRHILKSDRHIFGMLANDNDCEYGTILELRDCLLFEDGSYILTTIGVSRFRMIERDTQDGMDVALIERFDDVSDNDIPTLAQQCIQSTVISYKSSVWLNSLDESLQFELLAYGNIPEVDTDFEMWDAAHGPIWHWWIISILPLCQDLKFLILTTNSLHKRLTAISRVLSMLLSSNNASTLEDIERKEIFLRMWFDRLL
ncbi:uncharacterized protein LOC131841450 [Achroia grisella]|uniref:uncharacterized protein LOC131841450 n=1 Tax=Achroia grisella TaxID=688607 RepID=UPI0027D211FA|nr:uncharacterized protein LOC131841450 [Achroia grisella]